MEYYLKLNIAFLISGMLSCSWTVDVRQNICHNMLCDQEKNIVVVESNSFVQMHYPELVRTDNIFNIRDYQIVLFYLIKINNSLLKFLVKCGSLFNISPDGSNNLARHVQWLNFFYKRLQTVRILSNCAQNVNIWICDFWNIQLGKQISFEKFWFIEWI